MIPPAPTPTPTPSRLTRRRVLGLLAASGVVAVTGSALYETAPWLDYEGRADASRAPLVAAPGTAGLQTLIRAATLAASSHNTQPWLFTATPDTIEIRPDRRRQLTVLDPAGRELWISLGCALENLLIAARAAGYATAVRYPESGDVIRVRLSADHPQSSPLLGAIVLRQNTRSLYDGQPVPAGILRPLQAATSEPGVQVQFVLAPAERHTVLEYVNQGNLAQYADPAFEQELIHWLRFTNKEALASSDGLYTGCTGNPQLPRWLGARIVGGTKPQGQADADAAKFRSSSGAVLISTQTDDRTAWVRAGQVYERLALQMTALGVQSAFVNQPIEVGSVRAQLGTAMGLGTALPQLLLRFGHAGLLTRSLRRPVAQVLRAT